ncbi:MAG TPA: hypothetical protein VFZ28_00065 [Burkholderiaceae bacterium]|nr:hypothetical protein [Burkholderiaceae bacterium]
MTLQRRHLFSLGARRDRSAVALASGLWVGLAVLAVHLPLRAQQQPTNGGIYTCVDDRGKELRADRPIAECSDREQRVLNKDGSLKRIQPATLTPDERAARETRLRKEAEEKAAYNDAVRRDRNLKIRFPNEAVHQRAREAALESVRVAMRASRQRITELEAERRPLLDEAEFYRGRQLPSRLKQHLEANETSQAAQRELIQTQEAEMVRINGIYDTELEHLRKLWKGAPPGSISLVSAPVAEPGTR